MPFLSSVFPKLSSGQHLRIHSSVTIGCTFWKEQTNLQHVQNHRSQRDERGPGDLVQKLLQGSAQDQKPGPTSTGGKRKICLQDHYRRTRGGLQFRGRDRGGWQTLPRDSPGSDLLVLQHLSEPNCGPASKH